MFYLSVQTAVQVRIVCD